MHWNLISDINLIQENNAVVYCITNTSNNKVYIGSTNHFKIRIKRHVRELTHQYHSNKHLQNSWNKNSTCFVVEILQNIDNIDEILKVEQSYIDKYNAINPNFGYNIRNNFDFEWLSDESIEIRKLKSKNLYKEVYAFDKDSGELIDSFESVSEAARYFKTSSSNISRCCKGEFNYIKGAVFCYASNYDSNKIYTASIPDLSRSEETKQKMRKSFSKIRGKKIYVFKDNTLYKVFDSRAECERHFNYKKDFLRRKIGKIVDGYEFKYNK